MTESVAGHLTMMNAIWTGETTGARYQCCHDLLMAALLPGYRSPPSHQGPRRSLTGKPSASSRASAGSDPLLVRRGVSMASSSMASVT